MKSVKVTSLVLLLCLACIGLALVAAAPGQQAASAPPTGGASAASGVPAPSGTGTARAAGASAPAAISRSAEAPAPAQADRDILSIRPPDPADQALAKARALQALTQPQVGGEQNSLQQLSDALNTAGTGGSYGGGGPYGGSSTKVDPELVKWMQEAQKAEAEQGQLLAKYAQTTDARQRAEIKAELAKVLQRLFDLQLQQREREVSEIEARVKKLREMIDKRKGAMQSIVTSRLEQLLNEVDGMGWVAPSHAAPGGSPIYGPYGPAGGYLPSSYPRGSRSRSAAEPAPNPLQLDKSIRAPSTGAAKPR
jgi:hypothetical protein